MFQKINPHSVSTVTKVLCVDTLFRQNLITTESTNFLHKLAEPINNVVSIKLSSVEIPNNWFLFAKYNQSNVFKITCYNIPKFDSKYEFLSSIPYEEYVIEVPEGNYLSDEFDVALRHQFVNIGGGLKFIGIDVNVINTKTEFFTGTSETKYPYTPYTTKTPEEDEDRFYFKIDFTIPNMGDTYPLYKTIGWTLGFRKYTYIVKYGDISIRKNELDNNTYYAYVESESSYGSSLLQYIFLEVDDFQNNVQSSTIVSYNGNYNVSNNILAKVVVSSGQLTSITDNGSDLIFKKRNYFGPIRLEKMHIRVLNRFGEVLNLNGNNFSFTLEIETSYS